MKRRQLLKTASSLAIPSLTIGIQKQNKTLRRVRYWFEIDNARTIHLSLPSTPAPGILQLDVKAEAGQLVAIQFKVEANKPIGELISIVVESNGLSCGDQYPLIMEEESYLNVASNILRIKNQSEFPACSVAELTYYTESLLDQRSSD